MKLLVRNLARDTSEHTLMDIFEPFGALQACGLVKDAKTGLSKGFGFVEMPRTGEAKAAEKTLNSIQLDSSIIRVKKTVPMPEGDS